MLDNDYLINIIFKEMKTSSIKPNNSEDLKYRSYIDNIPSDSGIVLTTGAMESGFILPYMTMTYLTSKEKNCMVQKA